MSSDHDHHHHHGSSENLKVAFFLNASFTIIEFFGGLLTNSIAIMTDSVHDLGDSISLGLAWYFETISHRDADYKQTYGYRRYRLMGGLISGIVLLVGVSLVLFHAIGRLSDPGEVYVPGMLWLAVLGVIFNGAAVLRMRRGSSLTEKLVSWHLIEDALGWIVVLIGAGAMMIWDLPIIDPLLSIGISLFVLWNVGKKLKAVFTVLLQAAPEGFSVEVFEKEALEIDGVESLHHIHSWSIDGETHVLTTHVVLSSDDTDPLTVKAAIYGIVDKSQFQHITIETEFPSDECSLHD